MLRSCFAVILENEEKAEQGHKKRAAPQGRVREKRPGAAAQK